MVTLALSGHERGVEAQPARSEGLEVAVWLDRGSGPALYPGTEVRVYYRVSEDAHVALFHLGSDGSVSLVFPHHPGVQPRVRGGRTYRLLPTRAPSWRVGPGAGQGGFFAIVSDVPLDLAAVRARPTRGWRATRRLPAPFGGLDSAMRLHADLVLGGAPSEGWAMHGATYRVVPVSDDPRVFRYLRPVDPGQRARPVLRRRPRAGTLPPTPRGRRPTVRVPLGTGRDTVGRASDGSPSDSLPRSRSDRRRPPRLRDPGGPG